MKRILLIAIFTLLGVNVKAQTMDWSNSVGGVDIEEITGIAKNPTGIYYTGTFRGTVDFNPGPGVFNLTSAGETDGFVLKLDLNGNFLWAVSITGTLSVTPTSIIADNNSIYIAGHYVGTVDFNPSSTVNNSTAVLRTDVFYLKLNNNGSYLYHKSIGGNSFDYCNKIAFDNNLIPYLIGNFRSTADFNPDAGITNLTAVNNDPFVMKINPSSGGLIWVKKFDSDVAGIATGDAIDFDSNGNIFIAGTFYNSLDADPNSGVVTLTGSTSQLASYIIKLDSSGNLVWSNRINPRNTDTGYYAKIYDIKIDNTDNVYVCGQYRGELAYIASAPNSYGFNSSNYEIGFVIKYSNDNSYLSSIAFVTLIGSNHPTNPSANAITSLDIDSNNDVYLVGNYYGRMVNSNNPTVATNITTTLTDGFIVKVNQAGAMINRKVFGGNNNVSINSILAEGANVHVAGIYEGTADLDPTSSVLTSNSNGAKDFFLQKYTEASLGNSSFSDIDFSIYPNPVSTTLNLQTELNDFNYTIYSIEGKIVKQGKSNISETSIDVSHLNAGIYLVELESNGSKTVQKIIKN